MMSKLFQDWFLDDGTCITSDEQLDEEIKQLGRDKRGLKL